jgi:hypothetical protein
MALIHCSECNQSISDKASTCPHCGAPNTQQAAAPISQQTAQQAESVVEQGGTVCPFSGHHIPAEATVCVCGAYFGYKGGILTDQKFKLLVKLLGTSLVLLLLGYFAEWELAVLIGFFGTFVFGTVFLFFVLPTRLQGKRWWRQM